MFKPYLIFLAILISCNATKNKRNIAEIGISDTTLSNIKEIEKIIDLTTVRIDTLSSIKMGIYKIGVENERIPGPSDYYLISTFKIRDLDTTKLKVINILTKPLDRNSIYYKEWLSIDLINQLFTIENFSENKVYSAELFYKSPYSQGFFILQKDSTIYLMLQTQ